MSRRVDPEEQGQLQGANFSVISLSGLVGTILFPAVFGCLALPYSNAGLAGVPFLLASIILMFAAIVAIKMVHQSGD
jgi:DHA1 family tetracycline resistance protein-like MFS transporter